MSKGPGKWQRVILHEVGDYTPTNGWCPASGWQSVRDIWLAANAPEVNTRADLDRRLDFFASFTPEMISKSDREAIRRAMRILARAGQGEMTHGKRSKLLVRCTEYGA